MWWAQASTTCQIVFFSFFIKTLDSSDERIMFLKYLHPRL